MAVAVHDHRSFVKSSEASCPSSSHANRTDAWPVEDAPSSCTCSKDCTLQESACPIVFCLFVLKTISVSCSRRGLPKPRVCRYWFLAYTRNLAYKLYAYKLTSISQATSLWSGLPGPTGTSLPSFPYPRKHSTSLSSFILCNSLLKVAIMKPGQNASRSLHQIILQLEENQREESLPCESNVSKTDLAHYRIIAQHKLQSRVGRQGSRLCCPLAEWLAYLGSCQLEFFCLATTPSNAGVSTVPAWHQKPISGIGCSVSTRSPNQFNSKP